MSKAWREGSFTYWLETNGRVYRFDGGTWHSVNFRGDPLIGPSEWTSGADCLVAVPDAAAETMAAKVMALEVIGQVWDGSKSDTAAVKRGKRGGKPQSGKDGV